MPSIHNVKLSIEKAGDTRSTSKRRVKVTYSLGFSSLEVLAGSVFRETVLLRGDDPIWDDNLAQIHAGHVKAGSSVVNRNFAADVSRSKLDEDGDTVVFGVPIFADRDEIYARVSLAPFVPSGASASSNTVTGQFGAAGND